MLKYIYCFIF